MINHPPNSPEPAAAGAVSSAIAVRVTSRRWLSVFSLGALELMFILQRLFTLFCHRATGQLAGGTLVGAVLPAVCFHKISQIPPGGYLVWTIGGALAGFIGGLFLLSPKRFFGSIFVLLGIALSIVPMQEDGVQASARAYAIKIGIGLAFLILGTVLLMRAWRRLA